MSLDSGGQKSKPDQIILRDTEEYGWESSESDEDQLDADDDAADDDNDSDKLDDRSRRKKVLKHHVTSKFFQKNYKPLKEDVSLDLLGKPYLIAGSSLHTLDWSTRFSLLPDFSHPIVQKPSIKSLYANDILNQKLFTVKSILSREEALDVISHCKELTLQNVSGHDHKRNTLRMVIFDDKFAELIWRRIKIPLQQVYGEQKIFPLGFNVAKDKWEFSGINEAMRFNLYDSRCQAAFGPHRDAQFCPSGDERSIMSLVIYLNDIEKDFVGGETNFYFPKDADKTKECKGMTMKEELQHNSTLSHGYDVMSVKPSCGDAVIFTQNIIHESAPLKLEQLSRCKYIIKTDIIVKRSEAVGFSVSSEEKEDYLRCLNFFRMAQRLETSFLKTTSAFTANDLYEKCLSLRYSYPTQDILENWSNGVLSDFNWSQSCSQGSLATDGSFSQSSQQDEDLEVSHAPYFIFPPEVWMQVMQYLTEKEMHIVVDAMPGLYSVKRKLEEIWLIPSLIHARGIHTHFAYPDIEFFKANVEDCCRVLAIYSVFLIGNSEHSNTYTVSYDVDKHEAVAIPLKNLLRDVFYKRPCYGAVMKVMQRGDKPVPLKDLSASMDRRFMASMFSQEFVGCEPLEDHVGCDIRELEEVDECDLIGDGIGDGIIPVEKTLNAWDKRFTLDGKKYKYRWYEGDDTLKFANDDDFDPPDVQYKETLAAFATNEYVGGAITRTLKTPITLNTSKSCACPLGDWECKNELGRECETGIFNHLIIDFSKQTLSTSEDVTREAINKCCPFYDKLLRVMKRELKKKYKVKVLNELSIRCFTVNISALQESSENLSFNHASCNCTFINHHLEKYVSIRCYPYLNHMHVAFTEVNDKILVWTVYGGIVAL